jgi:sugar lactone lactonase YvrE
MSTIKLSRIATRITNPASYTWPITLAGSGILEIGGPITFSTTSYYFIISGTNITIDGLGNTITLSNIANYPGLVSGPATCTGIVVQNITMACGTSSLVTKNGWIISNLTNSTGTPANLTIYNCSSNGNNTVTNTAGIVGCNITANINNCFATGNIGGLNCGGIAVNGFSGTINYCYTTGTIAGNSLSGGILSDFLSNSNSSVNYCYTTGAITQLCGGIIGNTGVATASINYCYSTGNISGGGGICFASGNTVKIKVNYCYSTGTVSAAQYGGSFAGATGNITGSGVCNYCYFIGGYATNPTYVVTSTIVYNNCYYSTTAAITWNNAFANAALRILYFNNNQISYDICGNYVWVSSQTTQTPYTIYVPTNATSTLVKDTPNTETNNPRFDFSNNVITSFIDVSANHLEIASNSGDIRFLTNDNQDCLHVSNSGYVGINQPAPAYTLDVNGAANVTGNITVGQNLVGNVISAGVNWSIVNSNYSQSWITICYGNGTFVAVGFAGSTTNIMTSTDGINWKQQTKPNSTQLLGVCYGNGLFIAVGANGILYSTNSISWNSGINQSTITASFSGQNFYSVAYGNNTYVAVIQYNSNNASSVSTLPFAYYSYDGVFWYPSYTLNTYLTSWMCVSYGNQIFVAVGISGTNGSNIAYSYDGNIWTFSSTLVTNGFPSNSLCYGNGYFVAGDSYGNIYKSNNSTNNTLNISNSFISSGLSCPFGVAVDLNGYIYVVNENANTANGIATVKQYNPDGSLKNASFIAAYASTSQKTWSIAIDAYDNMYVVNGTGNAIYKYGISNGAIVSTNTSFITGLSAPQSCAFDKNGNFYVANFTGGFINKYSMSNGSITATYNNYITVSGSTNLWQMAFDSVNNLYLVNLNAGTVLQYTPTGTLITSTFISGLTQPLGIAIDAYGYIYVSTQNLNASNIYKYSSTGVQLSTLTSGLNYATQMCIVNGDLYTAISTGNDSNVSGGASYTGGTVSKITLYSFTMSSTPPLFIASGLASPYGFVTDTNGCVYVLNQNASSSNGIGLVIQYYPDGTVRNPLFVPPPATPISYCGIAIDASNNIYVTDLDKNKVYQFIVNASGNITTYNYNFITTGLNAPQGCAFDNSGNFYVSNVNGFINKYAMSNGVIQTTFLNFVTGTGNTWQMAFDSANNMYIATSNGSGIVYKAPPSSGASTTPTTFINIGSIYGSVIGVAVDSNGNVYVSGNSTSTAIIRFPSTGGTYPSAGTIIYSGKYITQLWIKNNYLYFSIASGYNTNTGSISKMFVNMSYNNTIITYGNGTFVMLYQNYLGTNGPLMYSTDISNNVWKYTTPIIPDGSFYRGAVYGNGMFVCVNQQNSNVLLSGSQLVNIPSAQSNATYGNVYINKLLNIRAYNDGLGAPYSGNLGLISKDSTSLTFNWALVRNNTTNGLLFQSSYGYQFYTNCTSSLSGTIALTVSNTGNVGVGSSATNPQYALDMSGSDITLFKSTKIIAGNTYALSVSDTISNSLLNNSYSTVNFTNSTYLSNPNSLLSIVRGGINIAWIGYIFSGSIATNKLCFYSPGGSASLTIDNSNIGINNTSPQYNLDITGTGKFTQNLQSGNLTCNTLSVTTPKRWFITASTQNNYTTIRGNILGSSTGGGGFSIVFYNDVTGTGNTDFNTTTGTFTAPEDGVYLFQLSVFDNASNNIGRRLAISGTGVPYQYDTVNNTGKYGTFNQKSAWAASSYTMTDVFYLTAGKTVYYYVPNQLNTSSCVFYYTYGHTNLKIFKIR